MAAPSLFFGVKVSTIVAAMCYGTGCSTILYNLPIKNEIGSVLNGSGWKGLDPKQRAGSKVKPEKSAPAQPSDHWVYATNQHPFSNVCYSLSFSSASVSDGGGSITQASPQESEARLFPTTQDSGRRPPVVTTASPVNVPNHHSLYLEDSGLSGSQRTWSTLPSGASDESAEISNVQTILVMHTIAAISHSSTPVPVTNRAPEHVASLASAAPSAKEKEGVRPGQPGLKHMRPGSDEEETTTTIITAVQSPGKICWPFLNISLGITIIFLHYLKHL